MLEDEPRHQRQLRVCSADSERAAAERSLDRTYRVGEGCGRRLVVEDDVDLILAWSPVGSWIDDDGGGDRAQRRLDAEPAAQFGAMGFGERRRSTGGGSHPRRVGGNRQVAIELRRARQRAVEYPGLSLFAIARPEAFALEVAEQLRHLRVLRKQRRRLRIGQVRLRRRRQAAATDLEMELTLHRDTEA